MNQTVSTWTVHELEIQNNYEAKWGLLCVVVLIFLVMFVSLHFKMIQKCKRTDIFIDYNQTIHHTTVYDLLRRKVMYIPMFKEEIMKIIDRKKEKEKKYGINSNQEHVSLDVINEDNDESDYEM